MLTTPRRRVFQDGRKRKKELFNNSGVLICWVCGLKPAQNNDWCFGRSLRRAWFINLAAYRRYAVMLMEHGRCAIPCRFLGPFSLASWRFARFNVGVVFLASWWFYVRGASMSCRLRPDGLIGLMLSCFLV